MFNGSNALMRADRLIRFIACNVTRFLELQPRSVPVKEIMEVLLLHLYAHDICCHLRGCFTIYMAHILNSYASIHLYVVLKVSSLQNLLF